MAIRKSAAEIETMLMDRLRGNRSRNTLERVAVMRGDDDGRWNAHPQMKRRRATHIRLWNGGRQDRA